MTPLAKVTKCYNDCSLSMTPLDSLKKWYEVTLKGNSFQIMKGLNSSLGVRFSL